MVDPGFEARARYMSGGGDSSASDAAIMTLAIPGGIALIAIGAPIYGGFVALSGAAYVGSAIYNFFKS